MEHASENEKNDIVENWHLIKKCKKGSLINVSFAPSITGHQSGVDLDHWHRISPISMSTNCACVTVTCLARASPWLTD